jgi:hypothetical protein
MNALGINMDFTVYAITFAILVSILTMCFVLREQNTVQQISGPPSPWLFGEIHALPTPGQTHRSPGHMLQLMLPGQYGDYEFQWLKHFGSVYRVKSCFGVNLSPRIRAMSNICRHSKTDSLSPILWRCSIY